MEWGSEQDLIRMEDYSEREKVFEAHHTVRGYLRNVKIGHICSLPYAAMLLLGLPTIIVAVWALIRCTVFLPITHQASSSVITISVLLMVVSALMITVGVGFVLALKYEQASTAWKKLRHHSILTVPGAAILLLSLMSIALGIAAAALSLKVSEMIQIDAKSTFFLIRNNEEIRGAWNVAQNTLRCCGVQSFRDYEEVFNNSSLPVSCCNTTDNSIANESLMCPDIDMDSITNTITTDLIYTEGCISQLHSHFRYTFSVIAGVSIIVGMLQLLGGFNVLYWIIMGEIDEMIFYGESFMCFCNHLIAGCTLLASGPIIFVTVGIWALVRVLFYYSITMPASSFVILISVLLIIAGVLILIGTIASIVGYVGICYCIVTGDHSDDSDDQYAYGQQNMVLSSWILSLFIVIGVGIAAAVLTSDTSETIISSANSTLNMKYLTDQDIQDTWNSVQETLMCCGAINFTDYEVVFSNMSVPLSCCNFTNPLVNMTTCPEIVSNAASANQSGLIYAEGCVSQLESLFHYTVSVIAGVSITVAVPQIAVITTCCVCLCVFRFAAGED